MNFLASGCLSRNSRSRLTNCSPLMLSRVSRRSRYPGDSIVDHVDAPDGVAGVDEVAPNGSAHGVAAVVIQPLLLVHRVGLPQEPGDLVKRHANASEEFLHPTLGVADLKALVDPVGDLPGGAEAALGNLLPEFVELSVVEPRHTALVAQFAQGVQPVRAERLQPFTDLPGADAQARGDLLPRCPLGQPQDGAQPTPDPRVTLLPAPLLDLLPQVGVQLEGHRSCLARMQSNTMPSMALRPVHPYAL